MKPLSHGIRNHSARAVLIPFVNESGEESSGGFWLAVNFLGLCAIAALATPSFLPVRTYSCSNACVNNLRQMDGAAQQWALENQRKPEDKITMPGITPYLKSAVQCPQGGDYTIGPAVSNSVTCSFPGHVLPP